MLDSKAFEARAEEQTDETVRASFEARRKTGESIIGKAGLLCVVDSGLAFVEDAILEPGEVTLTRREDIREAKLVTGVLDTTLILVTEDGRVEFESLSAETAATLVEAAELELDGGRASGTDAEQTGIDSQAQPDDGGAPTSEGSLDELGSPASAETALALPQEAWGEESLDLGVASAQDGAVDSTEFRHVIDDEEEEDDDEEEEESPRARARRRRRGKPASGLVAERKERPAKQRSPRKKKKRKDKRAADVGPYGWVSYAVGAGCAALALLYHWSVAILALFVGYVAGGYVAEQLNERRKRS